MPEPPPWEPGETTRAQDFAANTTVGVIAAWRNVRDQVVREFGSGTLVRLGARHFVVSAAHVIEARPNDEITVSFPSRIIIMWRAGDGIGRVWRSNEPDAAIIELNAQAAPWIARMKPMGVESIGRLDDVSEGTDVWVVGYPVAMQASGVVPTPPVTGEGSARLERAFNHGGIISRTFATWQVTNPFAAPGQRVLHVRHDPQMHAPDPETGVMRRVVEPAGVSGGPLLRVVDGAYRLCGIVRAYHEGHLRCEDVRDAIALLREHEDAGVRTDVERIVGPAR